MLQKPTFPRVWIFINTRTSSGNVQGHFSARSSCIEQQPLKFPKCHSLSPHPHGLYTISSWNASLWRLKNTALKYFVVIILREKKKKLTFIKLGIIVTSKASGSQHRKHDVMMSLFTFSITDLPPCSVNCRHWSYIPRWGKNLLVSGPLPWGKNERISLCFTS